MRTRLFDVLWCSACRADLELIDGSESGGEVRSGRLVCAGPEAHEFAIEDGLVFFRRGFDHEAVAAERKYSEDTFHGDPRLTDSEFVSGYPDNLGKIWPDCRHFGPDFRDAMRLLHFDSDTWTLDVGTGTCWTCRLLAEQPGHVVALDVVETEFNGLRTADVHMAAHDVYFERVVESMTEMPFRDASFDQVVFNASFHHSPDEAATLRECHRVLRPGGRLLLLHELTPLLRVLFPGGGDRDGTEEGSSHHVVTFRDLKRMASDVGFEVDVHLVDHVRKSLRRRLRGPAGALATTVFERVPTLLELANTSLVVLEKSARP